MKGVVRTTDLPTAVASDGNHYVLLRPGKGPRFMTVREVGRSFGLKEDGRLMAELQRGPPTITTNQALHSLGHVPTAIAIVLSPLRLTLYK